MHLRSSSEAESKKKKKRKKKKLKVEGKDKHEVRGMVLWRKPDVNLSIFPSLSLFLLLSLFLYIHITYTTWHVESRSMTSHYVYIFRFVSPQFVRRLTFWYRYHSDVLSSPSRENVARSVHPPSLWPLSLVPRRFACRVLRETIFHLISSFSDSSLFQSINLSIVCNYQRHLTGDIPWVSTRYAATQCNFSFCEFVKLIRRVYYFRICEFTYCRIRASFSLSLSLFSLVVCRALLHANYGWWVSETACSWTGNRRLESRPSRTPKNNTN